MPESCTLRYRISGADNGKASRGLLTEELLSACPHCAAVTALPIVEGIELILEFSSISPFLRDAFEPYVLEQILAPIAAGSCALEEPLEFRLLSQRFSAGG